MWKRIEAFGADETGGAAIEYALVAGIVSIAGFTAWVSIGSDLQTLYGSLSNDLPNGA